MNLLDSVAEGVLKGGTAWQNSVCGYTFGSVSVCGLDGREHIVIGFETMFKNTLTSAFVSPGLVNEDFGLGAAFPDVLRKPLDIWRIGICLE